MRAGPPTGYEQLPQSAAQIVDEACDRFERAWRAGESPLIEDHLEKVPDSVRSVLLREFILVEIPYRKRSGSALKREDYLARFPNLEPAWLGEVIVSVTRVDREFMPLDDLFPSRISDYEVLGEAGRGGMGVVYRARDNRLGRLVALKVLTAEAARDPQRLERFQREARAAGALNHPSICTVHALDEWQGRPYLVLEWIEGQTLKKLGEHKPSLDVLLSLLGQVAQALSVAHAAGIVHRDIKPENLMVRPDGLVKVLDFGLARLLGPAVVAPLASDTAPGMVMGTVRYMSPEQARGAAVESPTDVFSLGIVLYELAAGRHPFAANTMGGILYAIDKEEPTAPRQVNPAISVPLESLILRMLHKEARSRPTAGAVAAALQQMSSGKLAPTLIDPRDALPHQREFEDGQNDTLSRLESRTPARSSVIWKRVVLALLLIVSAGVATWWAFIREGNKLQTVVPHGSPEATNTPTEAHARQKLESVIAKLQALNPGYDGQRDYRIENGAIIELSLVSDRLIDITPLAELNDLKTLVLRQENSGFRVSKLADISPLKNLKLVKFTLQNTMVRSIAACEEMPLEELDLTSSAVRSLAPVDGKPIVNLRILGTDIVDVSPIKRMPLREAVIGLSHIENLNFLEKSDLVYLSLHGAEKIRNLEPLSRMKKLTRLSLNSTPVSDLKPLQGLPLAHLDLNHCSSMKDLTPLVGMSTLRYLDITFCPITDFTPLQTTGVEEIVGVVNPLAHEKALRGIPNLSRLNFQSIGMILP